MSTTPRRANGITLVAIAASSLLGLGSTFGLAAGGMQARGPSVTVSYRDLDLARAADVRTLYRRLQRAAASVCPTVIESELSGRLAWQRCYRSALGNAIEQVHSPELLALNATAGARAVSSGRG
jgi:UrcA family protein